MRRSGLNPADLQRLPKLRFLSLLALTVTADFLHRIDAGAHSLTHLELRTVDASGTPGMTAPTDRSGLLAQGRDDVLAAARLVLDILRRTGKPFDASIAMIAGGSACSARGWR